MTTGYNQEVEVDIFIFVFNFLKAAFFFYIERGYEHKGKMND